VAPDVSFARFVGLACHDLRTPLATVSGFAHTMTSVQSLEPPLDRYIAMIQAGSDQMAELLDQLTLVSRIEGGRYEPNRHEADTLELASVAATRLGDKATAGGPGGTVHLDREAVQGAIAGLALCALRHGEVDRIELRAEGAEVSITPITPGAAPVVLADDMRDLGAAAARYVIEAHGGSLRLEEKTLRVQLPAEDT
jgi:signal transduction histidine kinase